MFAIGGWRGLNMASNGVDRLQLVVLGFLFPEDLAGAAVQCHREQLVIVLSSQENMFPVNDRGRMSRWQGNLPGGFLVRTDVGGEPRVPLGNTTATESPELGPLRDRLGDRLCW